ncbi:hypothetical protein ABK040_014007 [Willaertia magna]
MRKQLCLATLAFLVIAMIASSLSLNVVENVKTNQRVTFNSPNEAVDSLLSHVSLVFKGEQLTTTLTASVSSLNLFERPTIGAVLINNPQIKELLVSKLERLFGKDTVQSINTLEGINFQENLGKVYIVTARDYQRELKFAPERSEVIALEVDNDIEIMTPTQRKLLMIKLSTQSNLVNNNTDTITDDDRMDYHLQLWIWVILIVCLILAVLAVNSIDYSKDQMLYALEMSKSNHE